MRRILARTGLRLTQTSRQQLYRPSLLQITPRFFSEDLPKEPYQSAPGSSEAIRGHGVIGEPKHDPAATGVTDPKVEAMINELSTMNLVQINELVTALKDKFGFVDAAPMMAVAAPGAAAPAEAVEEAEVKMIFHVKLDSFDASSKIKVIKEVRAATNLGLKESKEMVEGAPTIIAKDLPKEEAEALQKKLEEAGAKVSLE